MYQLLRDFLRGPENVQLAIAWFIPLIAAAIPAAVDLLKGGGPQVNRKKYDLNNYSPDSDIFNYTNALKTLSESPNAVDPYLGQQQEFRSRQMNLADTLGQTAAGQGPSLAQAMAEQNRQKSIAQLLGVVASQPGRGNVALSQRLAATGTGTANATASEQAQTGRLQEVFNAQSQLGQVLNMGRSGDLGAGGLASQGASQRQSAINAILALAQQKQASAAELAVKGDAARIVQETARQAQTDKAIGAGLAAAGTSLGTLMESSPDLTSAIAPDPTAALPVSRREGTGRTSRTTGGAQR